MRKLVFCCLLSWMQLSCFNPPVPQGGICGAGGLCPAGQQCEPATNRCYSMPSSPSGPEQDGGIADSATGASDSSDLDGAGGNTPCSASMPCEPDERCNEDTGRCEPAAKGCENGIQDAGETDVDCGGSGCAPCIEGMRCEMGRDCSSGVCSDLLCAAPLCGDGVINNPDEECDNGALNSDILPDACRTSCRLPSCGDGVIDSTENFDPPPASSPSTLVEIDETTCRFKFPGTPQLFCDGTCGNWDGRDGCQQSDADALCKLITGNPASTASSYNVISAQPTPGICCPPPSVAPGSYGCVEIADMTPSGVNLVVSVHERLSDPFGPYDTITVAPQNCTNP